MTKEEVRYLMKTRRNELPESYRNKYDKSILNNLLNLKEFRECDMLFVYVSFCSEVDTIAIIKNALEADKNVYIPRVEGQDMNFYKIYSLDGLVRSKFGILEPDMTLHEKYVKPVYLKELSKATYEKKLMLLPGLAFDKQGNRIGYGAGYYDKYLKDFDEDDLVKVGLAYDFQVVDELTTNHYDISADYIVTPERVYICNG